MFDFIQNWFHPKGLLPDDVDSRDIYVHELLGGEVELPKSYSIRNLGYRNQGKYPLCVAMATEKIIHRKLESDELSQSHLFSMGGGGSGGSSFKGIIETALNIGLVLYQKMPLPKDVTKLETGWVSKHWAEAVKISLDDARKIPNYARVLGKKEELKKAVVQYGGVLIGVYAGGTYYNDRPIRYKAGNNHAVVLTGWDENDDWEINDSLSYAKLTNGYRFLSKDYDIAGGIVVLDLPEDWREQRDEARKEDNEKFEFCLNHYGMPRKLFSKTGEQGIAEQMNKEFKKFNNQSVLEAAGLFWTIYINAVVYGGYSFTDVINDCYNWRRTGKHIFNFNLFRIDYKK